MRVLCVGSESPAVEELQLAVRFRWPDATFVTPQAHDEALDFVESEGADLVTLFASGLQCSVPGLCASLRRFSDVPLIVVGDDKTEGYLGEVKALEAGADDFIRPSADLPEVVARVVALMRRAHASSPSGASLSYGDLMLNPGSYEAFVGGRNANLTGTEFNLLHLLMRSRGAVVPHRVVERTLWGNHIDSSALVKKYVHRVRRKLADASDGQHDYIRSVYRIGYMVSVPAPQT